MDKWISWRLRGFRGDIPKRALLIGDEVIPLPPIPDENLEVYKSRIDKTRIRKSFERRERYCLNDSISIVLYAELPLNQRQVYSEYEASDDESRFFNIDYLQGIADGLENFERNEFEEGLKSIDSAPTPIDFEAPDVEDKDTYYLSIRKTRVRRAIMNLDGMTPQDIKEWEEKHNLPTAPTIKAYYQSIYNGKIDLGVLPKPQKQKSNNSKPKK